LHRRFLACEKLRERRGHGGTQQAISAAVVVIERVSTSARAQVPPPAHLPPYIEECTAIVINPDFSEMDRMDIYDAAPR
jgi:hypothetical protein